MVSTISRIDRHNNIGGRNECFCICVHLKGGTLCMTTSTSSSTRMITSWPLTSGLFSILIGSHWLTLFLLRRRVSRSLLIDGNHTTLSWLLWLLASFLILIVLRGLSINDWLNRWLGLLGFRFVDRLGGRTWVTTACAIFLLLFHKFNYKLALFKST